MRIGEGRYKVRGVRLELEELDYGSLGEVENLLDKLSGIEPLNSYITDYYQNKLLFMSESFCRFCGYSREEVEELGEGFYRKIFPPEDLSVHIRIAGAFMDFFYSLSLEDRLNSAACYSFPFYRKDGQRIGANRRVMPLKCTEDGRLWLSVSCVNYSSSNEIGGVFFALRNKNKIFSYSLEKDEWIEQAPVVLSEKEKMAAIEIYRGTMDKHIADSLCVSKDTISYYKRQIMQKTNTKTIKEALDFLVTHYII